jgi:hypothetical protein
MTHEERVQAVIDFAFTERQARFVVLVLRHGGVCVPHQYASFAGIANGGRRCNAFFDRLVRRGYARETGCVHNRARLYHLHHKPLYHAIGEATSTYRRRVSSRLAVERLMMLDAVLPIFNFEWCTSASEKAAYVASLRTATGAEGSSQQRGGIGSNNDPRFTSTFPIGREPDGRVVLVYLVTEVWPERFRRFLQDHVPLLRLAPTWTLRLVFPRPLDRVYDTYQASSMTNWSRRFTQGSSTSYRSTSKAAVGRLTLPPTKGLTEPPTLVRDSCRRHASMRCTAVG